MATQTTDQQNALKDAMDRAKQIAAKLQQQQQASVETPEPEETRKRVFSETALPTVEPVAKRNAMDGAVDHTDPKVIAQQVANSLVQRAGLGSMLVEEISMPNKLIGLVIGRGGEMINKLQSESGAKIQVAPDPPPNLANVIEDRQLTITGTTEAVSKAKVLLEEIRNGGGKVPERLMHNLLGEFSIEMIISQGKVGLVIGKGGETIKSLQERAGCKMVLFQDGEYANASEKPLRISGEQGTVMYGKQLVQDLLTSKELEAINPDKQHQDGQNYKEIEVPREAVGFVIGSKGANINQIQMETGCRVQFKNDMVGATKTAMLTGNPQQLAAAEAKLNEILQSNWGARGPRPWGSNSSQVVEQGVPPFGCPGGPRPASGSLEVQGPVGGPRGGWAPPGSRPFSGGLGSDGNKNLQPGHKHMIINVPANKCGLVIGKGGETLKYIHSETKVNIEISRDVPDDSPVRAFHVRGTDEMIENVLVIIREKINDPSITAKPFDANEATPGQNQWGAPPQQNQQWAQQNHWPVQQQQPWGQQHVQPDQWNQQGVWNQQAQPHPAAPGWNQPQPTNQQPNWEPQQQWQQPNAVTQGQWPNQQFGWTQPGQPYQTPNPAPQNAIQPTQQALNPAAPVDPAQSGAPQTPGQPDYSAAWALYYQQQSQYYQQYAMQQPTAVPGVTAATPTPSTGAPVHYQSTGTPSASANNPQAQAMADYQAKLAEYYKSLGQQPPPQ